MAVVKTAGEIVRRDIELEKSLRNAPGPGEANMYIEQLERQVRHATVGVHKKVAGC